MSEATARVVDEEVRRLVEEGQSRAREILAARQGQLRRLAEALLERETLSGEDIAALLA